MPSRIEPAVTPTRQEQEYLLRVIEAGVRVAGAHQLFLWTQGQLQALLPHRLLVGVQFAPGGQVRRIECVHGAVLDESTLARLRSAPDGLALRIARHCLQGRRMPAPDDAAGAAAPAGGPAPFGNELASLGFANVLVQGTGQLAEGASVFMLFGMPERPDARHAYFLELLLPHLHLALMRLPSAPDGMAPPRPLSAREADVMVWLRAGKNNQEIGQILGISALTVKNHLQRIYRLLGVSNRVHALARCLELQLIGR